MILSHRVLTLIVACSLLFFGGCFNQPGERQTGTPVMSQASQLPSFPEDGGLAPEQIATLLSLEKVDDHPLYVMHYVGEYGDYGTGLILSEGSDISCSLFASLGDRENMLYGRNFDWEESPALLLFTYPADGYASVSMVNLGFLNMDLSKASELVKAPLEDRVALLSAPWHAIDGMNEYGLTVSMAAVHDSVAGNDPAKKTVGSLSIMRLLLDHARSVDEAVAIFEKHNIDFAGGPPIHYLIADSDGKAVLIEFCQGKMILLPNENPWHLATNHLRCITQGDNGYQRYNTMAERLAKTEGRMDLSAAMQLLSDVSQYSTQWSVVYGMTGKDVHVVLGRYYESVLAFRLEGRQTGTPPLMPQASQPPPPSPPSTTSPPSVATKQGTVTITCDTGGYFLYVDDRFVLMDEGDSMAVLTLQKGTHTLLSQKQGRVRPLPNLCDR